MKETESGCFFYEHSVCIFRLLICSCPDFFGYIVHVRNTWCNSLLSAVRCFQLLKAIAIHHREVLNYLIVYFGVSFQAYILHWDVHIPPNLLFLQRVSDILFTAFIAWHVAAKVAIRDTVMIFDLLLCALIVITALVYWQYFTLYYIILVNYPQN